MQTPFFLARQPIVDEDKQVVMYEIFLRSRKSPDRFPEEIAPYKAAFIVIDLLSAVGYKRIAGNKKVMINFSIQNVLNRSYLETLLADRTVLNLQKPYTEMSKRQWELIDRTMQTLKREGFQFAFDIDLALSHEAKLLAIKYADYIVVPVDNLKKYNDPFLVKKQCIATKIENERMFLEAKNYQCDYFEGYYFGKPEPVYTEIGITALASNIVRILNAIDRQADLKEIEQLIKHDPGLVAKLLKFVNSSYFYLPLEIKSIRQALAYLGINNLKKYLLVLMLLELTEILKIPIEDYKKMLLTAIISEKLAQKLKVNPNIAFLGGLFFPSDLVFKMPPEKMAIELKLAYEIIEGYIEDNPTLYCIFYLSKVLAFNLEKDERFKKCLERLKLNNQILEQIYEQAKKDIDRMII